MKLGGSRKEAARRGEAGVLAGPVYLLFGSVLQKAWAFGGRHGVYQGGFVWHVSK